MEWKNERAESSMREGTEKIMKETQKSSKKNNTLFPEQKEKANKILENTKLPKNGLTEVEFCVGIGTNQLFPNYVKIFLEDESV